MIWNPETASGETTSVVVSHVTAEIEALCGPAADGKSFCLQELAKAVEHYVQEQTDGPCVDSQHLILLASQAMFSIGRRQAARRLYLLGSGMVRPSEWEFTGDQALWVLDLRQLTVRDGAPIEILLFTGLRIILDSIGDVWDDTRGRGVLGLHHVCATASALLGNGAGKKEIAALGEEIRTLCVRKLEQLKAERHWDRSPDVIDLDF